VVPTVEEQCLAALGGGSGQGHSIYLRSKILQDVIRRVAHEEIQRAHGEEAAEELREVQEDRSQEEEA
jgi:hypothetical protein